MPGNGVNIANFTLGRAREGGDALALLYVDAAIPEHVLEELRATGAFVAVRPLEFEVN